MATKQMKIRTDKQREEERCGGCDCFETDDGCECRVVPCSRCGMREPMYDMNHSEFHTDYWFDGLTFDQKLAEILCDSCMMDSCSEEDEENDDYSSD